MAITTINKRAYDYLLIQDQMDMQYKDLLNGTTTWKDARAAARLEIKL